MKRVAYVLIAVFFGALASADDSIPGGFTGVRDPHRPEVKARPLLDSEFVVSQAILWGGTFWDVDSTFRKLHQCPTCYEGNPRMVGLVARGKGAVWGEQIKWNLGATGVSLGLRAIFRKNPNWLIRHLWIVPPIAGGGIHIGFAIHNETLRSR